MKRSEIKKNREDVAKFLQTPGLEKFEALLENPDNPNQRCCIGHMCHFFKLDRVEEGSKILYDGEDAGAPDSLIELLGLHEELGFTKYTTPIRGAGDYCSLSVLNDCSSITAQEIGIDVHDLHFANWGIKNGRRVIIDFY